MQLISEKTGTGNLLFTGDYNILQFGRCGADYFTLDVRWPMTAVEAFGIAITTFDAYDSA
jgi:Tub family